MIFAVLDSDFPELPHCLKGEKSFEQERLMGLRAQQVAHV
jgi:hypothetical protein